MFEDNIGGGLGKTFGNVAGSELSTRNEETEEPTPTAVSSNGNRPLASPKEKVGDPIPGSRFVRTFCSDCGTPMRVMPVKLEDGSVYIPEICCDECEPKQPKGGLSGSTCKHWGPGNSWDNAVRTVEGG